MKHTIIATVAAIALANARTHAQTCETTQASIGVGATAPLGASGIVPSISASGTRVAFDSQASNLVVGDTNGKSDVFVFDRSTNSTVRVSVTSSGTEADGDSLGASISGNGRFVAFQSYATNLAPATHPGGIYLHDLATQQTKLVDVTASGSQSDQLSFFARPSYSARFVAFTSLSSDLVPNDSNGEADIFVRDMQLGVTTRVSVSSNGAQAQGGSFNPAIAADGRFVAFTSDAANLVAGDTNLAGDIFIHDRQTGSTTRVSVSSSGAQADSHSKWPVLSADARFVAFQSDARNLVLGDTNLLTDIFLHDRLNGLTTRVDEGPAGAQSDDVSGYPSISADGRFVAFESDADTLLPLGPNADKHHVFRKDVWSGAVEQIDVEALGGGSGLSHSYSPAISADAFTIVFASNSTTLTNPPIYDGVGDIFVRACSPSAPLVYCIAVPNSLGCPVRIASWGTSSASASSGFDVSASGALNHRFGLLFYGTVGANAMPFDEGFLCVAPPLRRTHVQNSGGNVAPDDCSGTFHLDFNAYLASHIDSQLVAGARVWAQYWSRDSASPSTTNVSDALAFELGS